MKNHPILSPLAGVRALLLMALAAWFPAAHAQIYVVSNSGGDIEKYDANTGATLNFPLVTGLNFATTGIAVSGTDLFAAEGSVIGEYDTTTGAAINASFITGLSGAQGIVVSGNNLYVVNINIGAVGEYDATTGATINASLIQDLNGPGEIAVAGSHLFVANSGDGAIGEYDAITGATINQTFIPGLAGPDGLVVSGSALFETNHNLGNGAIGVYNVTTGAPIDPSFVSGLSFMLPGYLVVQGPAIPEPSTCAALAAVGALGVALLRRRRAGTAPVGWRGGGMG